MSKFNIAYNFSVIEPVFYIFVTNSKFLLEIVSILLHVTDSLDLPHSSIGSSSAFCFDSLTRDKHLCDDHMFVLCIICMYISKYLQVNTLQYYSSCLQPVQRN